MTLDTRIAAAADAGAQSPDITCDAVLKRFGDSVAVDAVTLSVRRGEFVSLLGPSGCGKTTLLRMIGGFETPSSGRILIRGVDAAGLPPNRRPTNIVFQSGALFPHLDVGGNVAYGLRHEGLDRAERGRRVGEVLELVGLAGFEARRPHQLSGGQAQRVAIARALVKRPAVLLLDEPLSALDLQLQLRLRRELADLHRRLGTTFVYVTHNQQEALELSDRIVVMDRGRIQQIGTGDDIYNRPASQFVAGFIGETNLFAGAVSSSDPAGTEVAIDGAIVRARAAALPVGSAVAVAVRPGALRWAAGTGEGLHAVVRSARNLGSVQRLELVRQAGAAQSAIIVDLPAGATLPAQGTTGTINWRQQDAVALPGEAAHVG